MISTQPELPLVHSVSVVAVLIVLMPQSLQVYSSVNDTGDLPDVTQPRHTHQCPAAIGGVIVTRLGKVVTRIVVAERQMITRATHSESTLPQLGR